MSDDKQLTSFITFSLPFCMGLFIGLIAFNPSEGFIAWWGEQEVEVLALMTGIGTIAAAVATGFAARSSAKAAEAASQSANQWRIHASYDKYIDTGVKARIKLRWLEARLDQMCNNKFSVFFEKGSNVFLDPNSNDVDAFLICLDPNFIDTNPDEYGRFSKYKASFKYQSDRIREISTEAFNEIEETYELSKNRLCCVIKLEIEPTHFACFLVNTTSFRHT
ncbi:hypothetical protein CWO23_26140 [Vibrio splendidus]|uniref:hypothetical protein n=2 Tax=Vibrio splendidus TaxID=29497 RepID=UPI000D36695D|nr:hypothetical protein [Vibrio splendidus]PTP53830.1 hypothetical protein CWO23_26140 [Vibrio splendidus]